MASSCTSGHIAVCPLPFASHPASLLRLCRKTAAATPDGFRITLFATAASTQSLTASLSPSEARKIQILALDDGRKSCAGPLAHPLDGIKFFMVVAGESLRKGIAAAEEIARARITCLVTDGFLSFAVREIAEERGVKWAVMWTPAASGFTSCVHHHELRRCFGEEGVERYVPGFPPAVRMADLPHEVVVADLPGVIASLSGIFGDRLCHTGPYALTLQPSICPAAISDPHGCLPWLDARGPASVVYISFGTAHSPPAEEFCALTEALKAMGAVFLSDRLQAQLPEGCVGRAVECGNGKIVPWAPQPAILTHSAVGAHLTHCGWNFVMDSVWGGVPIIGRPFGIADQPFNKRMVESVWCVGMGVEGGRLTKEATKPTVCRCRM